MATTPTQTRDALAALASLTPEQIRERLDALAREQHSLRVLLRYSRARHGRRERCQPQSGGPPHVS
jgi:hypothetical protein